MPNIKQQKKRVKTDELNRQRNVAVRSRMKTYLKKVDDALEGDDAAAVETAVVKAISEIDRAQQKGVIHANSAARKKSSLRRRAAAKT